MMRSAVVRSTQEIPYVAFTQTRQFFALQKVEFSDDLNPLKITRSSNSLLSEWGSKKTSTEGLMVALQAYKDIGDSNKESYLEQHNPRTFEDMEKPVPNFKALHLKPGDVPKFFDTVLTRRVDDSLQAKKDWWAQRKAQVESATAGKTGQGFPVLPVPDWKYGKVVSLENMKSVTDAYIKSLEPTRKLKLPMMPAQVTDSITSFAKSIKQEGSVPEIQELLLKTLAERATVEQQGKPIKDFKFMTRAEASKVLAKRRAEVHKRYVNYWAKKLLVSPELAVVPMKEVDAQLASNFENLSPKYQELLQTVALGTKTTGERVLQDPSTDSFFVRREKHLIPKEDFPPTPLELEAVELAKKYEDPEYVLASYLGETLAPLGAPGARLSEQVRKHTEHKYTSDRYFYKEGMKLAARLEEEEKALEADLKALFGESADVAHFQAQPPSPLDTLMSHGASSKSRIAALEAEKAKFAGDEYMTYAITKHQEFISDPSNISFDEVLLPEEVVEMLNIELAELNEVEASITEAEDEELWTYTLVAQSKHIQKHYGNDLPGSVLTYMDPLTFKKFDWEVTNPKFMIREHEMEPHEAEEWATEALSHHFLPIIRYRRAKARQLAQVFKPTMV